MTTKNTTRRETNGIEKDEKREAIETSTPEDQKRRKERRNKKVTHKHRHTDEDEDDKREQLLREAQIHKQGRGIPRTKERPQIIKTADATKTAT